jgi:phosphonate transport system substrate-binding protein
MFYSRLVIYFFALLIFTGISSNGTANAQESLKLCIHPYLPATELLIRFTPLADYLGKKIGQPVELKIAQNYQQHIDCAGRDEADISYMGPMPYVKMANTYGRKPLLARLQINHNEPYCAPLHVVGGWSEY